MIIDCKETETNYFKFKLKLQQFLRNDGLSHLSVIAFIGLILASAIYLFSVIVFMVDTDDKFDRNIYSIGKSNYKDSYIIYNADLPSECKVMSEDGEREIDLMYVVFRDNTIAMDSNFPFTTKISKIFLVIASILFSFQILAYCFNKYKTDDGEIHHINSENDDFYCGGILVTLGVIVFILSLTIYEGTYYKNQIDEVYTEAILALDLDLVKETNYLSILDTRSKVKLVNKYLKKNVYQRHPLMYSIKEKKYLPFDLKTIKNFNMIETMFDDKENKK